MDFLSSWKFPPLAAWLIVLTFHSYKIHYNLQAWNDMLILYAKTFLYTAIKTYPIDVQYDKYFKISTIIAKNNINPVCLLTEVPSILLDVY